MKWLFRFFPLVFLLYVACFVFFEFRFKFELLVVAILAMIVVDLIEYLILRRRLSSEPMLVLTQSYGPREAVVDLAFWVTLILLANMGPEENLRPYASKVNTLFYIVVGFKLIYNFFVFRYHRRYYLTEKGILKGTGVGEVVLWENVVSYQIDENFGTIKLKNDHSGSYILQMAKEDLASEKAEIETFIQQKLN